METVSNKVYHAHVASEAIRAADKTRKANAWFSEVIWLHIPEWMTQEEFHSRMICECRFCGKDMTGHFRMNRPMICGECR